MTSHIHKLLKCEVDSDFKVVNEIFKRKIYDRQDFIQSGETWLDIGANIGAFSLYVHLKGCKPIGYEPCIRNYNKLLELGYECYNVAIGTSNRQGLLYLERNNHWRHHTRATRRRLTQPINIMDANDLPICDGMKIDIEGDEVDVIYHLKRLPSKLIFEYDGGANPKKIVYDNLLNYLKQHYKNVQHIDLKQDIKFFPNGLLVKCWDLHPIISETNE